MSEAENIFKRVLHKALEETASAAVEAGGSRLLMRVLPYVLANPAASIVAAVTKELMAALLDQSSLMEKKIDKLMEVPFRAGARELLDCLETRPANETEKIFWIEKLNQASSHLDEAYASADAPGKKLLVRAMQTSVVALIPGGTSFFNKYIQEFRDVSRDMKTRSAQLRKEADEMGQFIYGAFAGTPEGQQKIMEWRSATLFYQKKADLEGLAENLMQQAKEIDLFVEWANLLQDRGAAAYQIGN